MPFLISQNKKVFIATITAILMIFSTAMLFTDHSEEVTQHSKASIFEAQATSAQHAK